MMKGYLVEEIGMLAFAKDHIEIVGSIRISGLGRLFAKC